MQKPMFPDIEGEMTPDMVQPGTRWQHHAGKFYRVIRITNRHSQQQDKFPLTAVYVDEQWRTWSRPVKSFIRKFKLVD